MSEINTPAPLVVTDEAVEAACAVFYFNWSQKDGDGKSATRFAMRQVLESFSHNATPAPGLLLAGELIERCAKIAEGWETCDMQRGTQVAARAIAESIRDTAIELAYPSAAPDLGLVGGQKSTFLISTHESDGRTWLTIKTPNGSSASLSCKTNQDNGETVTSKIVKAFALDGQP